MTLKIFYRKSSRHHLKKMMTEGFGTAFSFVLKGVI